MEPFPPLDTLTPPRADDDLTHVDLPLETRPGFDFILHIGMAGPRKYYTMETCAHRDGYVARDQAGESFEHDTYWRDTYKSPEVLRPGFDVEDVWRRWKSDLMVRPKKKNPPVPSSAFFFFFFKIAVYCRDREGIRLLLN